MAARDSIKTCKIPGCVRNAHARGFCSSHYQTEYRQAHVGACSIIGCTGLGITKGLCPKHYCRLRNNGDPLKVRLVISRANGEGSYTAGGYLLHHSGDRKVYEHVRRAEVALGKRLPGKAHVHHVDYNRANNENSNLVICPNQKYHRLLHSRTEALDACGHADWRRCRYCKQYDAVSNLYKEGGSYAHRACSGSQEFVREDALTACGHSDWRKCLICKQWDDVTNLYKKPRLEQYRHKACHTDSERKRRGL